MIIRSVCGKRVQVIISGNAFYIQASCTCVYLLGKSLAVLKSPDRISACEILPNGAFVAVALEGRSNLMILALKNYGDSESDDDYAYIYGNQDNQDKVFKLEPN